MFSIVIPLYNKEKFVKKAVGSVLGQTFVDLELIVVNDGSTDGSTEELSGITDERLRIIEIPNSGVSVARNTGIKAAKFDWIGLLDADDWWDVNFLSEMNKAIGDHPDHRMFASGRFLIWPEGTKRYAHELLPAEGTTGICNYYEVISKHLPVINSSNSVIAKSLFEAQGYFRPGQKKHEDHDLWLRLCVNEQIVVVNKPLSFYRNTEVDTGSKQHFDSADLLVYLNTLRDVKQILKGSDLNHFDRFAQRYCVLTYLKYYWHYSPDERSKILDLMAQLISSGKRKVLKLLSLLPFNLYPVLKIFKR